VSTLKVNCIRLIVNLSAGQYTTRETVIKSTDQKKNVSKESNL
jgi:hypothetical protein